MSLKKVSKDTLETTAAACAWLVVIAEACDPPRPDVVAWLENLGQRCHLEQVSREAAPEISAYIDRVVNEEVLQ